MTQINYIPSKITLIAVTKMEIPYSEDQMPVLAARVSHGADGKTGEDFHADIKLTNYLADHHHTSPFEHVSATFKVECPLFIRSEWHRHRTQSYNEISMRYTSDMIGKVWGPDVWRSQASRNKQSSEGNIEDQNKARDILRRSYCEALTAYNDLLRLGVCREQARAVIPTGHMTEFYATANLLNWHKFCKLRQALDAQYEIRILADEIDRILSNRFPISWSALQQAGTNV